QQEERLFDIASQLALGAARIVEPREKADAVRHFLRAGRKAKAATAYQAAIGFLAAGMGLLATDGWETQYEQSYALFLARAECEWLSGSLQEAEHFLGVLHSNTRTKTEKLAIYGLEAQLRMNCNEWALAAESG